MGENLLTALLALGAQAYDATVANTDEPLKYNEALLMDILEKNADTEYGKKYGFANIKSIDAYRTTVPFSTYDDYGEAIERMTKGEHGLIIADAPACYVETSGSIGVSKLIPMSEAGMQVAGRYGTPGFALHMVDQKHPINQEDAKILLMISCMDLNYTPDGTPIGDIAGITMKKLESQISPFLTTPVESLFCYHPHDRNYVHLRFGLMDLSTTVIFSGYMTEVYELTGYLLRNHESIINDIEQGIIDEDVSLPEDLRATLTAVVTPQPERAAELRKIMASEDRSNLLRAIWPKLALISGIGGDGFQQYTEKVAELAKGIDFYHYAYASSEGAFGMAATLNQPEYTLLTDSVFFEFIELAHSSEDAPPTLTMDQLEVGKEYEVVVTNTSGFYRYRMYDVVQVVKKCNQTPVIQFSYRMNQLINMAGEKTSGAHMLAAIEACGTHFGCCFIEYAVYPDLESEQGHYTVLLETDRPEQMLDEDEVSRVLHQCIGEANPEFRFMCNLDEIGPTVAKFVQPQTFALFRDKQKLESAGGNQIKPVRVINSPAKHRFFFALLGRM